jgi:hypothetical protein
MKIQNFSNYNKINEEGFKSVALGSLLGLLSSLNLTAQNTDKISKSALSDIRHPEDLENLERISTLCDSLNKEEISWSDISEKDKLFFELVSQPLINLETSRIRRKAFLRLTGDKTIDIELNAEENFINIEIKDLAQEAFLDYKKTKKIESFVFDKFSLNLSSEDKIITPHIDITTDLKLNRLEASEELELNLTPTHFKPSFRVIRLVDDFMKASYTLENVRIYTVLGVWNKNLLPGSRTIGFQFPFHR